MNEAKLQKLCRLIRYYILSSTTKAGSGHPTSSLSAVELMAVLFFGGYFRFNLNKPEQANNDRLIFSKGHAAPLLYSLYAAAGKLSDKELMSLRKFGSKLEGHPTLKFPYTEAATGSLGQGLSVGLGMALNAKYLAKLPYKTFVLLGDSEMAEGSQWEAIQLAAYYKLDNLIGILDVNRLGQRGTTMYGHDLKKYKLRIESFGWKAIIVKDGHSLVKVNRALEQALKVKNKPVMIIAKTVKGKGVSFLENKNNWHGRALNKEQFGQALSELGKINYQLSGQVKMPLKSKKSPKKSRASGKNINYQIGEQIATRMAFGDALANFGGRYPQVVSLDAETSNSTKAELFAKKFPDRFFEMFIAEQNMVSVALGLSRRGLIPFVSTFAAFFSRAFDQIRMSQYSDANIKFVGSHAGVSIGEDGFSQMGLEDIAMFRTLLGSVILYPADAVAANKLTERSILHQGNVYLRNTRSKTPVIYKNSEVFKIGGSKVLKQGLKDKITVVAAGITVFEALKAYEILKKEKINIRVIDAYSIKPLDEKTLLAAAKKTNQLIVVEDHFAAGGLGEAIATALSGRAEVHSLCVRKMPKSGRPEQLLNFEQINSAAIIKKVKEIIK